jgi:hypothetical protein
MNSLNIILIDEYLNMYEQSKDLPRVTLNDKFIGDEGCGKLAEFIGSHRRIEAL